MRLKIVFLCLSYHFKSKSAQWFQEILNKHDVQVIALNADAKVCYEILDLQPDVVICWQTEEVSPWFNANGIPAIAVPMADAVGGRDLPYFTATGLVGAISFTDFVHEKFKNAGLLSYNIRYYPNFTKKDIFNSDRSNDIFLGYRGKQWEIPLHAYLTCKKAGLSTHLHDAKDFDEQNTSERLKFDTSYFKNKEDLEKILLNSKYFLCPRHAEGIGMFTLDAMAKGCIPIGADGPGNNDYIDHGVNGYLLSSTSVDEILDIISEKEIDELRKNLYLRLDSGLKKFEDQKQQILPYIKSRLVFYHESKRNIKRTLKRFRLTKPEYLFLHSAKAYKVLLSTSLNF